MTTDTYPCPCELHEALAADPNLTTPVKSDLPVEPPAATTAAPLLSACRRCGEPSQAWICAACDVPPDPSTNRRTLEALIRAALEMRAFLAEPTPYDAALLGLARAVRRERIISLGSDELVANEYADAPAQFLADFDQMTPAQQARVSLRVARAWEVDISVVDQLWLESRERLAEMAALLNVTPRGARHTRPMRPSRG